jgi:hypothetical protein
MKSSNAEKHKMPVFKKERRNGMKASFSRSQPDKLFINGKFWRHGKPFGAGDQTDE